MKIKDILESIDSVKTKICVAYRIFYSTPKIKKAIKQWKAYGDLPVIRVTVETSEENFIEISSYDLLNKYGFDELSALLMLDDIEKAQEKQDKEKLNDLLAFLVRGKHEVRTIVSQELLEQIKKNNPEVWDEYQKLCANSAKREKELEEDYSKIIETEL
ncbi:MAG: hypothetical protein IKV26_03185 [Paludibacteraceae bacterium]|nr:hypothetical protein [Paludibacteraceae bacterium]